MQLVITHANGTVANHPLADEQTTSLGREGCDILISEAGVSRYHASLHTAGGRWVITDQGSSNGTFVNGVRIHQPTWLAPRDSVALGGTVRLHLESVGPSIKATPTSVPGADVETIAADGIEVRYIAQSAGRRAAKSMLDSARRARARLAGFGSEADHGTIVIHLTDPVEQDGVLVTTGSLVDAESSQLWCIVSSESRPEDPTRALALIFGASLPGAGELEALIAGYGLQLIGEHDATPAAWQELEEPQRARTAAAFVRHLVEQTDDETVRRFLSTPATKLDATAQELFGQPLDRLQRSWIAADTSDYKSGQFVRLAFKRLWPYRLRQAEVFVYMLLSLAFSSAYPFVTQRLLDDVLPSGDFGRVWKLLLVLLAAFGISLIAGVRRSYQSAYISASVIRDLRQEMFDRVQRLSSNSLSHYQQGELLSRMFQDVGQLQSGLSEMINTGIFQFVSLLVSGAIMLSVNVWLGLLVMVIAPVVAVVYRVMGAGAQVRSVALQEAHAGVLGVAAENYQAGPVIKLFRLEERESRRFGDAMGKLVASTQRMALFNGYFGLSVNFIVTLLQLTVLGLGAWLIFEGRFTIGGLVAFLSVMSEFISPVTSLTTLGQTMQESMGSLKRIEEVANAAVEPAGDDLGALAPLAQSIELRNLSFSYTPERRTLDGLNVTIPAGTRTAFVGPSGSGKSTVLQVLMRLIEPDEGSLLLDGVDVRERSLVSLRSQIGVVFQDPFLFDISLAANIGLGADNPTEAQVAAAAEAAEISSFTDQLPDGIHSLVGEGGSFLSGGQRQRAAIARALVGDPRLLILDEATSALDPATERAINQTIDRAVHDRTVISVTHRLTAVADYDLIVVLVDGRIESQGTHEQLLAEQGTYARLWAEQTGSPLPVGPAFDTAGALADLAPLRGVPSQGLASLVASGRPVHLDTGGTITAPQGGLVLLSRGRADLHTAAGEVVAALPGDALGVPGLLVGRLDESRLVAAEPIDVLVFDPESIAEVSSRSRASFTNVVLPSTSKALPRATVTLARPRVPAGASSSSATALPRADLPPIH